MIIRTQVKMRLCIPRCAFQLQYRCSSKLAGWMNFNASNVKNLVMEAYAACQNETTPKLHPSVISLGSYIERNDQIRQHFEKALLEVPFGSDVIGNPQIRNYRMFLKMLNHIIASPPRYENHFFLSVPVSTVLNWAMHTPSGHKLFLDKQFNEHLKAVLNQWAVYLSSSESRLYLTDDKTHGWIGASVSLDKDGNEVPFHELYQGDPSQPYYGFTSWDSYFTRKFRPGQRSVIDSEDNLLIVNSCESSPYRVAHNVKREDDFWLKGQPYSLRHMLADDESVDYFTGGTVFQAFLSPANYHRWHSPVNGRVIRIRTIDGCPFAMCPSIGFDRTGCESQAYFTEVATRSLIFIECDNPAVGLMCFMAVGMGEIGSCEVTCTVSQRVRKGDELGMFHFGGSTYCLLFGPQVKILFELGNNSVDKLGLDSEIIPVNHTIAKIIR